MTSPDMQSPAGALAPNVVNTLQEFLASPIGAEAEEILGALAQFGDSLVARFFRGYTSVVDIFDHAFDELGAELGGIPGMSGVTAWVTSIEELVGTAMRLIDGVFDGVQEIANGLSKAVTGKDIEGNIAEGMHGIVEGLTFFLKLVNLAMDLIQELIDGVLGVAGGTMSQLVAVLGWVIDIANQFLLFFHGFYDVFKGLFGWSTGGPNDRPLEKLFDSIPNLLTAFSPLNAAKLVGEIPGALLQGVQDAIDGVSDFLQDLVNAILRAIRGIPVVGGTLADIIAEVGGLQQKATTAQADTVNIIGAVKEGAQGGNLGVGNPLTELWNNMFGLHQAAQSALTSAAAANTQLAAQQQNDGAGDTGVRYGTTFGGANEAALSGPWTSSDVVIKNGYAGLRDAATTNSSNYLAKTSNTASRDDYVVAVVLGDQGDAANTRIVTRADLNFTMGVYVNINKSGLAIGRWTNNGGTLTQWASVSVDVAGGAAVRVRAVGKQYTVMLNGVDVLSYTDTATTAPFGPAYRSAGFTLGTDTGFFGFRYYSFRLASFMLADYNPPGASTMDSWRLSRASNTDVALNVVNGATAPLPSSFLTTQGFATGVTVSNLGKGEVTVAKSGHYWISFGGLVKVASPDTVSLRNTTADAEIAADWCLFVNGAVVSGAISAGVPFPVFLNAGDVVNPGVVNGFSAGSWGDSYDSPYPNLVFKASISAVSGPSHFSGVYMGA